MNTKCHICKLEMDTNFDKCPQCEANLLDPQAETVVLNIENATMLNEKRDKETPVIMILTNLRVLMLNNEEEEVKPVAGGLIGGAIGGAIAGARAAENDQQGLKIKDCVAISLETIETLSTKGLGLIKVLFLFTFETKDGNTYYAVIHKKLAPQWEAEIQKRLGK